jgi:hypothetical protein
MAKRHEAIAKLKVLLEPLFHGKNQECRRADIPSSNTLAKRMRVSAKFGLNRVDQTPPTVVLAGSGVPIGPIGTEGIFGAITGCKRR